MGMEKRVPARERYGAAHVFRFTEPVKVVEDTKRPVERKLVPISPVVTVSAAEVARLRNVPLKSEDMRIRVSPTAPRRKTAFPRNACGRHNDETLGADPVHSVID